MKKSATLLLLLLSFLSKTYAQNFYRKFPIPPDINSRVYNLGESAPITPTSDGGYLLNYNYGYPDLHGGPIYSEIIKTDANFTPLWKKNLWGSNGRKIFTFNDGSSIIYQNGFSLNLFSFRLEKIDPNGQPIWNKYDFETDPNKIDIIDGVQKDANNFVLAGVKVSNVSSLFGGQVQPILMEFDNDGNFNRGFKIKKINITNPASQYYGTIEAINKDNSNYVVIIKSSQNSDRYIVKLDSSFNIVWSKNINYTIITPHLFKKISILNNGDILILDNYTDSSGFIALMKINSNGQLIWYKKVFANYISIKDQKEISSNDFIISGTIDDLNSIRNLIVKFDTNGNILWSKKYFSSFMTGEIFEKTPTEWYFTGFNYSTNISDNHPFLFSIDHNGNNSCIVENINLNSYSETVILGDDYFTTEPLTLLTPLTYTSNPSVSQSYEDGCISLNNTNFEKSDNILISPNPSNGIINLNSIELIEKVTITNTIGQNIETYFPNNTNISIAIKNNGIYLLTIQTQKGIRTRKVIIEK